MSPSRRTDPELLRDVGEELAWDTRVDPSDINLSVSGGVVTLTGTVGSWTARLAAQEAAQRVRGVFSVVTDLVVVPKPPDSRQDMHIATAVRHALEWHARVPDGRIRSTVSNGVVTLEGEVDFWSQFEGAERCVRNLVGVREVRNLIVVGPRREPPSAHVLRASINQALARHIAHAAGHVDIRIEDGKVVLTGNVPSWAERQVIEGAVRGTPGVSKVETRLVVR